MAALLSILNAPGATSLIFKYIILVNFDVFLTALAKPSYPNIGAINAAINAIFSESCNILCMV